MTERVYEMIYKCLNCVTENIVLLEYGKPTPSNPPIKECEYCGCNEFQSPVKPKYN